MDYTKLIKSVDILTQTYHKLTKQEKNNLDFDGWLTLIDYTIERYPEYNEYMQMLIDNSKYANLVLDLVLLKLDV